MLYRTKEEVESWRQRDPVPHFRQQLIEAGLATADEIQAIEARVQATLDEAVEFAASSPQPDPESALAGVYFQTHEGSVF